MHLHERRLVRHLAWVVVIKLAALAGFVHTVSAGYVTGAMFVLSISSWYLLKGRDIEFARRSFSVASAFGLASVLSVIAWPNEAAQRNDWSVEVPYLMGLIGTRSISKQIPGIRDIKARNRERIQRGIVAVQALETLRRHRDDPDARATFELHKEDLGFGLLLKKYVADVRQATPEIIERAVHDTVPRVTPMFWSFRVMVGLGMLMLALFALSFWTTLKGGCAHRPWLLRWALWMLPAPWLACELGWFVAEYGRQPWTIYGVLPTHLSVSTLTPESLYGSLAGFVGFYTVLLVVEVYLMQKFARQGPGSLGTGRYDHEPAHA